MTRVAGHLGILFAGALLGIIWIVFSMNSPKTAHRPPVQPPASTDYYVHNADIEVMDMQGVLTYRMHTEETLHYPDKSARLKTVHVDYLDGPDGVWQLDALHGQIAPSQETVLLTDGVRIHSEMQDGPMVITTPEATVDLKGKHITSMEAVTVESPGYHAQALGMEAGFRSRDLTLLKDVQSGLYAKP